MTPATPPVPPSAKKLSVKEQRTAQRAKKLEAFRKQEKRSARNRRIGIIAGIVVAVAVVALLITSVVLTPKSQAGPNATYSPGGDGATIEGVETFDNVTSHAETAVSYAQTPPAGGEHSSAWLNCGVYTEPVPNENAVHDLEHGAIWVTYDPSLSAGDLDTLRSKLPSTYTVLSPYEGLPSPIVLSGWNVQLQVDSADDARIPAFFEEYWQGGAAPELGAACSGGIDGPGKVS